MPFPDSPRAIYKINPLDQVICQLRFPSILKIDTQSPYEFQELIRSEYPLYSEENEVLAGVPLEVLSQLPQEVIERLPSPVTNKMNYRFISADENWIINLTNSFLALTANKYDRWETFRDHLELPVKALLEYYKPAFFSRIGLRYVDVINRSGLHLESSNWIDLIQPYILGILSANNLEQTAIKNSLSSDEIQLDDNQNMVRIIHGLATSKVNNEVVYLIDCDFFSEKRTEVQDGFTKLDGFNHEGRKLFRWCITDLLHNAMQPVYL